MPAAPAATTLSLKPHLQSQRALRTLWRAGQQHVGSILIAGGRARRHFKTGARHPGADEARPNWSSPALHLRQRRVGVERVERGVEFTQALSRVARGDERPEFNTTKAPEHGTGLGLSQIREFAHRACGAIALESELGRGTTATLYLPRAIERASGRRRNRQHQRG